MRRFRLCFPTARAFLPRAARAAIRRSERLLYRVPDGRSTYDALQVRLGRRLHDRLQFRAGYTLARVIDDSQGTVPTESDGSVTAVDGS